MRKKEEEGRAGRGGSGVEWAGETGWLAGWVGLGGCVESMGRMDALPISRATRLFSTWVLGLLGAVGCSGLEWAAVVCCGCAQQRSSTVSASRWTCVGAALTGGLVGWRRGVSTASAHVLAPHGVDFCRCEHSQAFGRHWTGMTGAATRVPARVPCRVACPHPLARRKHPK